MEESGPDRYTRILPTADRHESSEFGRFFAAHPDIEKHLGLKADATSGDMLRVIQRFSGLVAA